MKTTREKEQKLGYVQIIVKINPDLGMRVSKV